MPEVINIVITNARPNMINPPTIRIRTVFVMLRQNSRSPNNSM